MGREEIRFPSGDDECAAWLFRPKGIAPPAPCVVLATGLSCVRDQGLDRVAERFAAAGFAALVFDYRYFGDSGGEPRGLVTGARQRADLRAALAAARSLDGVDPDRLVLWGYSFGGANVQAVAAADHSIAAAICVAPLVDSQRSLLHVGGFPRRAQQPRCRPRLQGDHAAGLNLEQ